MIGKRGVGMFGIVFITLGIAFVVGIISAATLLTVLKAIPAWLWYSLIGLVLLRWLMNG